MIRSMVERMLSGVVVRRSLPLAFGAGEILASAGSGGLKFLFKPTHALDPSLLEMARQHVRPGSVVWDIGANVGLFSVAAAGLAGPAGKVFAIEADLDVARQLLLTARLPANRRHAPISVLAVAAGRCCGVSRFAVAARARASNALEGYGSTQMGGVSEMRLVATLSLDQIRASLPAPAVLKIDVEGAEVEVLEGAMQVIAQDRPVLICEVSPWNSLAVATILRNAGYRMFDGAAPADHGSEVVAAGAPWDTVGIPREHATLANHLPSRAGAEC